MCIPGVFSIHHVPFFFEGFVVCAMTSLMVSWRQWFFFLLPLSAVMSVFFPGGVGRGGLCTDNALCPLFM